MTVKRCQNQLIEEPSFTRRPGSGCPRQTSHRDRPVIDHHIIPPAHVDPTASLAAVLTQAAPLLRALVSS
ncbi:hypothetical protein TNCV_2476281 [Trichonephila clavipes]|nr:hypothetical protein TNCV_2476281 [Trichonephila clavipes]